MFTHDCLLATLFCATLLHDKYFEILFRHASGVQRHEAISFKIA
jgi:hypothetical protein